MKKTDHVINIDGFLSFEEADKQRCKLKHKDLYGLYGIYKSEDMQLWSVMPIKILDQIMAFDESKEKA